MSHTFKPGDRVVIVRSGPSFGCVATVVLLHSWNPIPEDCGWFGKVPDGTEFCVLDMPSRFPESCVAYPHRDLKPYTDDGREKVSWSECLWQPKPVRERA